MTHPNDRRPTQTDPELGDDPERALRALTARLTADDVPGPDPAFGGRLWRDLTRGEVPRASAVGAAGPTPHPDRRFPVTPPRARPPRLGFTVPGWSAGAWVTALAVVAVALTVAALGQGGAPGGPGRDGGSASDAASAVATPGVFTIGEATGDCRVSPRPVALVAAPREDGRVATPAASLVPGAPGNRLVAPANLPAGRPAPEEALAGIRDTLEQLHACVLRRAGEDPDLVLRRVQALYTDDYFRRYAASPREPVGSLEPPPTAGAVVLDARVLPDGRIGATVVPTRGTASFLVFARQGDRYLIDELVLLAVFRTPTDTTFVGQRARSTALILVVDVSGSMSYDPLGGAAKIELAKEAVGRAADALGPDDWVGVLAFNHEPRWVVAPAAVGTLDRAAFDREVAGMTAEGGTELLPALTLALDAAQAAPTDDRRVVILSDGKSRTGTRADYERVLLVRGPGVTVSAVAVGDADTELLLFLAEASGGTYHLAARPEDLPPLTERAVRTSATPSAWPPGSAWPPASASPPVATASPT